MRAAGDEIDAKLFLAMIGSRCRTNSPKRNQTMTIHKPTRHALAFALILTGALSGCATYNKCGIDGCRGDAKITANVEAQFDQYPELGGPNSIHVQTLDHVVYLSGLVSAGIESRTAESVAREVPDVSRVVNSVAVAH